jgi:hypothetical protein
MTTDKLFQEESSNGIPQHGSVGGTANPVVTGFG